MNRCVTGRTKSGTVLALQLSALVWLALLPVHTWCEAQATGESVPQPQTFALTPEFLDTFDSYPGNLGPLPRVPEVPFDNLPTPDKISLGRKLFFDPNLSSDRSVSCASCHEPSLAFADGRPVSIGVSNVAGTRNSPTILNSAFNSSQFWDGRSNSLEEQASAPLLTGFEMGMLSEETVVERVLENPEYVLLFENVFGSRPAIDTISQALACYERTLVTPQSRYDDYLRGDKTALTELEKEGLILFFGKASCTQCHNGSTLSDGLFHNVGLGKTPDIENEDQGRYIVTGDERDRGAFRTPQLRNVELTAPYMHDGSLQTLDEVIEFYDRGGDSTSFTKSEKMRPLGLSADEKEALRAFMESLTDESALRESKPSAYFPPPKTFNNYRTLRDLMAEGVHEHLTYVSFNISHNPPLDVTKRQLVDASLQYLLSLARQIQEMRPQGWPGHDEEYFAVKLELLEQRTHELRNALSNDSDESVSTAFSALSSSCSECHTRFRPDLVGE